MGQDVNEAREAIEEALTPLARCQSGERLASEWWLVDSP